MLNTVCCCLILLFVPVSFMLQVEGEVELTGVVRKTEHVRNLFIYTNVYGSMDFYGHA